MMNAALAVEAQQQALDVYSFPITMRWGHNIAADGPDGPLPQSVLFDSHPIDLAIQERSQTFS